MEQVDPKVLIALITSYGAPFLLELLKKVNNDILPVFTSELKFPLNLIVKPVVNAAIAAAIAYLTQLVAVGMVDPTVTAAGAVVGGAASVGYAIKGKKETGKVK